MQNRGISINGAYAKNEEVKLLNAIRYAMSLVKSNTEAEAWDRVPGNSITYTYYTGVEAGNPSGATTNVKTAAFSSKGATKFTQTYTYNAADDILTVTVA